MGGVRRRDRTAVCIIRIEVQGTRFLIAVRTNADIMNVSAESAQVVGDVEDALAAVRAFFRNAMADDSAD